MKYEINLISDRKQQHEAQKKSLFIARSIAGVCIVLLLISAVTVFFIKNSLTSTDLPQQEQAALASLAALHQKIVNIALVNDRMGTINKILHSRSQYDLPMDALLTAAPSDITIASLTVTSKKITLEINDPSLKSIDTFFAQLSSLVNSKRFFRTVTLDHLSIDSQSGQYTAMLTLILL